MLYLRLCHWCLVIVGIISNPSPTQCVDRDVEWVVPTPHLHTMTSKAVVVKGVPCLLCSN